MRHPNRTHFLRYPFILVPFKKEKFQLCYLPAPNKNSNEKDAIFFLNASVINALEPSC